MIHEKDFEGVEFSFFLGTGFDKATLLQNLKFAPDWLPEDYAEFFQRFTTWSINGIELAIPGPAFGFLNHLEETVAVFHDENPGYDHLFPIAEIHDDCFVVLTNDNGSISCGNYIVGDDEWYEGHPFASFTEWAYSQLDVD